MNLNPYLPTQKNTQETSVIRKYNIINSATPQYGHLLRVVSSKAGLQARSQHASGRPPKSSCSVGSLCPTSNSHLATKIHFTLHFSRAALSRKIDFKFFLKTQPSPCYQNFHIMQPSKYEI